MVHFMSQFMTICAVIIGKCLTLGVNGYGYEKLQRYKCNVHQNGHFKNYKWLQINIEEEEEKKELWLFLANKIRSTSLKEREKEIDIQKIKQYTHASSQLTIKYFLWPTMFWDNENHRKFINTLLVWCGRWKR